jgi:hypothetical protein
MEPARESAGKRNAGQPRRTAGYGSADMAPRLSRIAFRSVFPKTPACGAI